MEGTINGMSQTGISMFKGNSTVKGAKLSANTDKYDEVNGYDPLRKYLHCLELNIWHHNVHIELLTFVVTNTCNIQSFIISKNV